MNNIASNETSSLAVTVTPVPDLGLHFVVRMEEDGMGETEIDYVLDQYDLAVLINYLKQFLI